MNDRCIATIFAADRRNLDTSQRRQCDGSGFVPSPLFLSTIQGRAEAQDIRWSRRKDGPADSVRTGAFCVAKVHIRRRARRCELLNISKRGRRVIQRINTRGRQPSRRAMAETETLHIRQRQQGSEQQSGILLHQGGLAEMRYYQSQQAPDFGARLMSVECTPENDQ